MMIAISNIAWDVCEYEEVAALLHRYSVDAIDIVPGKYFPKPDKADESEIARVRDWWAVKGIEITGMQALLFGTSGLNLFAAPEVQTAMLRHLNAVCRIASGMGAKRLVFGSPKNRDRSEFGEAEATEIANDFFHRLGDVAGSHGVVICLEPNPPCYGANFMTDSAETARVVTEVAHPAIRMQLDTGAITINGEDPENVIGRYASLIGHIHASPSQKGQLPSAANGSLSEGNVRGGNMAILTRTLADALAAMPRIRINHFTWTRLWRYRRIDNDEQRPAKRAQWR